MFLMGMRCRVAWTMFDWGFGAREALGASSAGAYGWSDGLPHPFLSSSNSQLSLSLLCALSPSSSCCCCSAGKWIGLLFAASASHSVKLHYASGADGSCACVCVLSVCMCIHRIGFWDLECVFVLVFAGVYLARSFSTLHAGLEQADKLFAKTGN